MTDKTIKDLFSYYIGYWIVKLGFDNKYKFNIKRDNRISCQAYIEPVKGYEYNVKYNSKRIKTKWKIIHVILHELGHIVYDLRMGTDIEHEYVAELFALKIAKDKYPEYYPKMVEWTKSSLSSKTLDDIHYYGYLKALKELGEIKETDYALR